MFGEYVDVRIGTGKTSESETSEILEISEVFRVQTDNSPLERVRGSCPFNIE